MAACTESSGKALLHYAVGGRGQFRLQAESNALDNLRKKYACNGEAAIVECSPEGYSPSTFKSIAGCSDRYGQINLQYSADVGFGASRTEAKVNALVNLRKKYTCGSYADIYDVRSDNRPSYCQAACADRNGYPDLSYSKAASGNSFLEAVAAAVQEVKRKWNCGTQLVVTSCE
jgi:hypothetical protein